MILSYTAAKRKRSEMVEEMHSIRIAYHADKKQFTKAIKDLS